MVCVISILRALLGAIVLSYSFAKGCKVCFLNSAIHTPTRFHWLMLVQCFMQFHACSIYILLMLIRFIFISAASSPFQVCSSSAISLCNTCLSFTHPILVLFLVSFNVYATPSFSQLCSPSIFFLFFYTFYTFQFKFYYLVMLSF